MNASTPQLPATTRTFAQRLSSTRRGARLARLLAGSSSAPGRCHPPSPNAPSGSSPSWPPTRRSTGAYQGRDFRLALTFDEATAVLRIEVTDTRGEKLPVLGPAPQPDGESGRGLLLVAALADRWGTEPHHPVGKTVWAELDSRQTSAG